MRDLLSRPIAWAIGALLVIGALFWLYSAITTRPKAEARLSRNQAGAAVSSGGDAVNTTGKAAEREDDLDRKMQDANREVDAADNAAGADAAGAGGLCSISRDLCR